MTTALGGEQRGHPSRRLLAGCFAGSSHKGLLNHREARPDQPTLGHSIAGEVEEHDRAVQHQGFIRPPVTDLVEVGGGSRAEPQVRLHLVDVVRARLGAGSVAFEHARVDAELAGHERHSSCRRRRHVGGAEPQQAQPRQLQRPAEPVPISMAAADLSQAASL